MTIQITGIFLFAFIWMITGKPERRCHVAAKIILGIVQQLIASFVYMPSTQGLRDRAYNISCSGGLIAVLAYLMATVNSCLFAGHAIRLDRKAKVSAELGTVFCLLATVTGAIWSKAAWGLYWNWDCGRLHCRTCRLRSSIADEDRRARLSAVYAILLF